MPKRQSLLQIRVDPATAARVRLHADPAADRALAAVTGRPTPAGLAGCREQLCHQTVRDLLGLPVLSLFSPEAGQRAAGGMNEQRPRATSDWLGSGHTSCALNVGENRAVCGEVPHTDAAG